jgi:NADH:ubiquinone oxidoreductase subunit 3 (subunit A)
MVAWFIVVAIAVAIAAVAIVLLPRPKQPKPDALKDYDNPTAEAGRPFPVPFGTITIKGLNNLWFGDKQVRTYKTKA